MSKVWVGVAVLGLAIGCGGGSELPDVDASAPPEVVEDYTGDVGEALEESGDRAEDALEQAGDELEDATDALTD